MRFRTESGVTMKSQQSPKTLTSLAARTRATGPVRVAVADAVQEVVLATMRRAMEEGLAEPHLVGPRSDIEPLAAAAGLGLDPACLHDSGAAPTRREWRSGWCGKAKPTS